MNKPFPILALFLAVSVTGCDVDAPRPHLAPPRQAPALPLSTLSITLAISQDEIARLVNARTETTIADLKDREIKCPVGRCRLDLTLTRTGPAGISLQQDRLGVRLPFRLHAAMRPEGMFAFAKGEAQGMAQAATSLSLGADWQLHSTLNGRLDLSDAHLRIGPIVTNVAELGADDGLAKPIWRMLDDEIARLDVKPRIEAFWNEASTPIRVGRKPGAWLVLKPESLGVMQPQMSNGMLTLSLKLSASGEVEVQETPPPNPISPLPKPAALAQASNDFEVAIPFLLPYGEAERLALASLREHPPVIAGTRLEVSELHILPSADDVAVETRFCADPGWDVAGLLASCAHVYLFGRPEFDPRTETLRVTGLRYDVASAGLMLRLVHGAFLEGALADLIARHLVFDEKANIERLERNLAQELGKPHGKTLAISMRIQDFAAPSLLWTGQGFSVFLSANGTTEMAFKP